MRNGQLGLSLGSGAARAFAHIGIIQQLEAMNIKPDVISGCSLGAFIGCVYITGKLAEFTDWLLQLKLKDALAFADVSINSGGVVMGERLNQFFFELFGDTRIESLPVPFATIATDLTTGKEVWFKNGLIVHALRASMSLPGLIAPYNYQGKWLIDGGIVNPVPVSICRALGADVVIGVNLNGDVVGKHFTSVPPKPFKLQLESKNNHEDLSKPFSTRIKKTVKSSLSTMFSQLSDSKSKSPGIFDVLAGTINIMQDKITRSRMAMDSPEILLEPQLSQVGLLEYYRASETIKQGEQCVKQSEKIIQKYMNRLNDHSFNHSSQQLKDEII